MIFLLIYHTNEWDILVCSLLYSSMDASNKISILNKRINFSLGEVHQALVWLQEIWYKYWSAVIWSAMLDLCWNYTPSIIMWSDADPQTLVKIFALVPSLGTRRIPVSCEPPECMPYELLFDPVSLTNSHNSFLVLLQPLAATTLLKWLIYWSNFLLLQMRWLQQTSQLNEYCWFIAMVQQLYATVTMINNQLLDDECQIRSIAMIRTVHNEPSRALIAQQQY